MLKINDKVPNFEAEAYQDDEIKKIRFSDYKGKWMVHKRISPSRASAFPRRLHLRRHPAIQGTMERRCPNPWAD
jgi:hypothetical protein